MSGDNQDHDLDRDGFTLRRGVLGLTELPVLRAEADRVALAAGSACVRRLGERSPLLAALARSPGLMGSMPSGMRLVRSILFDKTPRGELAGGLAPGHHHRRCRAAVPARRRVLHYEYAPVDALDARLTWAEPELV